MILQTELQAYSAKINLPLLNSIVAFVLDTAEATHVQRNELYRKSPLLYSTASGSEFQEKYGFLYLGELLERYEERFGMTAPDLRAIALAMGYTHEFATNEMFVGSQRDNFLRKVRQSADGDVYLTGALYLLGEGQSGATERELSLTAAQYDATEDLLFALSLFHDSEQAFLHFRPQLLRLLGKGRTMPVLGNMTAWSWLTMWLTPHLKAVRGKDMALFRSLCTLPISRVKADSKHHDVLLAHGYTPLAPEIYDQLTQVYRLYERFKIKCYGHERMGEALKDGIHIQNTMTLLWFSGLTDIYHPAFTSFDIMDSKWDRLAAVLAPVKYCSLFEGRLNEGMSREEIQNRLDRYKELTGLNYADMYWDSTSGSRFNLLVNKGILNLWSLFQSCLDENGNIVKTDMRSNIWGYVQKISTVQAYQFFEKFFTAYGAAGLEKFFDAYRRSNFFEALTGQSGYSRNEDIQLKLRRDYLDDDGHRQLLRWLEEYIFIYQPERYISLVIAILRDDFTAGLFSAEEQRKLFDLIAKQPNMRQGVLSELKRRYLTEAELQADREAEAAARQEAEHLQQVALVQSIREHYEELLTNSFSSVISSWTNTNITARSAPLPAALRGKVWMSCWRPSAMSWTVRRLSGFSVSAPNW